MNLISNYVLSRMDESDLAEVLAYLAQADAFKGNREARKQFENAYRCSCLRVEFWAAVVKYGNDYPYLLGAGILSFVLLFASWFYHHVLLLLHA